MGIKVAAIVPTCRGFTIPEQTIEVDWYVVHDEKLREVHGDRIDIVAPDVQMYGQRASSIRGAGIAQAYLDGADYILTVDDDCHLPLNWASSHVSGMMPLPIWTNTIPHGPVRGYPNDSGWIDVVISHGVWDGVPDLSGEDQKRYPKTLYRHEDRWRPIQAPFPMSSMNVGFTRFAAPLMYFWPMGGVFDRYEDIWCGICAQRVFSSFDYRFMNGGAVVYHSRASDAGVNALKEAPGAKVHEKLWPYVWDFRCPDTGVVDAYLMLAKHVGNFDVGDEKSEKYFSQVSRNMRTWVDLLTRR